MDCFGSPTTNSAPGRRGTRVQSRSALGAAASSRITSAWMGSVSWNSSTKSQRYFRWSASRTSRLSRSRVAAYWSRSP